MDDWLTKKRDELALKYANETFDYHETDGVDVSQVYSDAWNKCREFMEEKSVALEKLFEETINNSEKRAEDLNQEFMDCINHMRSHEKEIADSEEKLKRAEAIATNEIHQRALLESKVEGEIQELKCKLRRKDAEIKDYREDLVAFVTYPECKEKNRKLAMESLAKHERKDEG